MTTKYLLQNRNSLVDKSFDSFVRVKEDSIYYVYEVTNFNINMFSNTMEVIRVPKDENIIESQYPEIGKVYQVHRIIFLEVRILI